MHEWMDGKKEGGKEKWRETERKERRQKGDSNNERNINI